MLLDWPGNRNCLRAKQNVLPKRSARDGGRFIWMRLNSSENSECLSRILPPVPAPRALLISAEYHENSSSTSSPDFSNSLSETEQCEKQLGL